MRPHSSVELKPTVFIYRDQLLAYSETFISDQASALQRFRPVFVGIRSVKGLPMTQPKLLMARNGWIGRADQIWTKHMGPGTRMLRRLAECEPTLIHSHFLVDAATAAPIAKALDIPLVISVHGYDATSSDERLAGMGRAERIYLNRRQSIIDEARQFLCVSEYLRQVLEHKGFPKDKLSVHYTGTDTAFFTPKDVVQRTPNVLFVGRLVECKGGEFLIRAMSIVQKRCPEATLTIIGDGPLRPKLESLANSSLRSVQFLGSQTRDAVRRWMNKSMVFSVPSVIAEGFGMVFAEAQSMGLPVASFSTGGIPEAVSDGETGLLATEGDHQALADNIEALLTDAALWSRMSSKAQERVRTRFDLTQQTARLETIYSRFADLPCSAPVSGKIISFTRTNSKRVPLRYER